MIKAVFFLSFIFIVQKINYNDGVILCDNKNKAQPASYGMPAFRAFH